MTRSSATIPEEPPSAAGSSLVIARGDGKHRALPLRRLCPRASRRAPTPSTNRSLRASTDAAVDAARAPCTRGVPITTPGMRHVARPLRRARWRQSRRASPKSSSLTPCCVEEDVRRLQIAMDDAASDEGRQARTAPTARPDQLRSARQRPAESGRLNASPSSSSIVKEELVALGVDFVELADVGMADARRVRASRQRRSRLLSVSLSGRRRLMATGRSSRSS